MRIKYVWALAFLAIFLVIVLNNHANGPYWSCTEKIDYYYYPTTWDALHNENDYPLPEDLEKACIEAGGGMMITFVYFSNIESIILVCSLIGMLYSLSPYKLNIDYNAEKKIDSTTTVTLYSLSLLIPLCGCIVGAIFVTNEHEHYKHVGKYCLILSLLNLVISIILYITGAEITETIGNFRIP